MSITIRQIAVICGVSIATVSRVINEPEKVAPETRQKVQAVIDKYNYVPNQIARNLGSRQSNSLALFVFDIVNPFFTNLIRELNSYAFDNNYALLICDTSDSRERELRYVDFVNMTRIAGLILTEGILHDTIDRIDASVPVVCIDRQLDCDRHHVLVTSANREGARTAMEYLVNLNHRRIGFLGGPAGVRTAEERKKGYLDVIGKYELPIDERYILAGDFKRESGVQALEYFLSLDEPPTAIFCANDLMAEGVLSRALSLNLSVPGDLSVVGFDGVSSNHFKRLTTVRQSVEKISEVAMTELIKMIRHGRAPSTKVMEIPTQFVVGETCQKCAS
jgi:DNA-binding LacI/PurR family transcriptional regulator